VLTVAYLIELFPFATRAKGLAIFLFCGRLSTVLNTFFYPAGVGSVGWEYYFMYVIWLLCGTIVVYFLFPETKGPSLEELAFCKSLLYYETKYSI
jgi:hypothetical protein